MSQLEQVAATSIRNEHPFFVKGKYRKTVLDALSRWLDDKELASDVFDSANSYLPDLYCIDEERKIIGLMEIEDFSKLKIEKLHGYADFMMCADTYGITVELYTADRYGRNVQYLNLLSYAFDLYRQLSNTEASKD